MKKIILLCALLWSVSLACLATGTAAPTAPPTFDANSISTLVVQTAEMLALSATATETSQPSETPTETPSATPSFTLTPSETPTMLIIPTLTFTPTQAAAVTVIYIQITNTSPPATATKLSATNTKVPVTATKITATNTPVPATATKIAATNTKVPETTATIATKPPLTPSLTPPPTSAEDLYVYVNQYRGLAGSPPVTFDATLNNNCWEHARYMAENNDLTHNQNPTLPYASEAGQICAQSGNAFIGSAGYTPRDSIDSWMSSVGHRLWLLYPTTPTFGYGFYANKSSCAAGLDVLSRANMDLDEGYANWPLIYPAPNQTDVPAAKYAITLNWRYFGETPIIHATNLSTADGQALAHTATTSLPVGHKGILISPSASLPPNTAITVQVTGSYNGADFEKIWSFTTGR